MRCTHHHHPNLNCKEILQSFWYHLSPYSCTQNLCSCDHTDNLVGHILIVWAIPRSKGQEFTTNKLTQVERSLQVPTSHSQMESCLCSSQSSAARGTQLSFCLFLLPLLREHLGVTTQRSSWGSSSHEIHQWLHCRDLNNLSKRTIILVSLALSNMFVQKFPNFLLLLFLFAHIAQTLVRFCTCLVPQPHGAWNFSPEIWDWFDCWRAWAIQDIPIMYTTKNLKKIVQGIVFLNFLRQPEFPAQLVSKWLQRCTNITERFQLEETLKTISFQPYTRSGCSGIPKAEPSSGSHPDLRLHLGKKQCSNDIL